MVRTELIYLRAQQAKRRASGHLSDGDSAAALKEIRQAQREIAEAQADAPESLRKDLAEEAAELDYLVRETETGSQARAGKYMSRSSLMRMQKRGRPEPEQPKPPAPPTPPAAEDPDAAEEA